jgi:hypothetical protein
MSKLSASQRGVRANREGITGNLIDAKAGGGHCLRCDCSRRPAIRTERQAAEPSPTKQFDRIVHREIAKCLLPTALQTTQGLVLAQAVVEELRRRCIVLPPVLVGVIRA